VTLPDVCAAVMFVGIILYALLAGADFGAGLWDLVAGSAEHGQPTRALIEESIAPVWEANHVWLIFVLVTLWTAFPTAFAPIMSTLYVPLTIAAVGIILRGAAFAFRKETATHPLRRLFGVTFASSSVLTPFMLGAVVGGIASGRVPAGEQTGDALRSWLNPTSMLGGAMAVVVCAFLAAVYLTADAERRGREKLVVAFRRRAVGSAVVAGVVALVGVFVLKHDAPDLFHGLTRSRPWRVPRPSCSSVGPSTPGRGSRPRSPSARCSSDGRPGSIRTCSNEVFASPTRPVRTRHSSRSSLFWARVRRCSCPRSCGCSS
jgi:cytochrome d ubiquinol oxidase subunit II